MSEASELLRLHSIEIRFDDHRSPEEIAQAIGLLPVAEVLQQDLPKRPRNCPYLAF